MEQDKRTVGGVLALHSSTLSEWGSKKVGHTSGTGHLGQVNGRK
jgi:hypothetical protein